MKNIKTVLLTALSSLFKVFLVAALVFMLGWTLVQIAEWKTREPAAEELPDETIMPPATNTAAADS